MVKSHWVRGQRSPQVRLKAHRVRGQRLTGPGVNGHRVKNAIGSKVTVSGITVSWLRARGQGSTSPVDILAGTSYSMEYPLGSFGSAVCTPSLHCQGSMRS